MHHQAARKGGDGLKYGAGVVDADGEINRTIQEPLNAGSPSRP